MTTKSNIAYAGNKGPKVRSDCFVTIELTKSGGIKVDLTSKVKVMFGKETEKLAKEMLTFFGINNANICIEDTGALKFVLAARIEAVINKLIETDKEYLFDIEDFNKTTTKNDIYRFSRLYLPGNTPSLMINAGIHNPEGVILDLEDAVAPDKKHEARYIVRNALRSVNYYGAERMVRINQVPLGLGDLDFIIPHNVNLILLPKCESAEQIVMVNEKIATLQKSNKTNNPVWLMPIIESSLGVVKAFEIASAADNVVALAIGLEDYTADLGTRRTNEGSESFYARCAVVNACRAAGIQPIDSVFSDISDMEALKQNVLKSKSLGFDGMGCIHPRQIKVVQENFGPDEKEIDKAKKIVSAFIKAKEKGLGVVSLGSKMIDAPVVKRAERTIDLAIGMGKLNKNWINE